MKDPIILRHKHLLSPKQSRYWNDLLYRVTKVGTELEVAPPKGMRRPDFERAVQHALEPSNSLDWLGKTGVLDVHAEHCGIELRVIGRQPDFKALQRQYQPIMATLLALGGRPRATCGLHFHLLTPGLAEPVPEIILANFWNLVRRYAPELKFLTSGGDRPDGLCRRRNPNSHLEMVHHSPVMMSMADIQCILRTSQLVPEHQNFLNLEHIGFVETGDVLPFHVEVRFPDADLSPTSVTAKTFLFFALLLKAVDLSQYGVIHVGKIDPWRRKVELLNLLSNNDGTLAASDTSGITPEVIDELRLGLEELLDLLTPSFSHFLYNPALEVLRAIAYKPISLLRCEGLTWEAIEAHFQQKMMTSTGQNLPKFDETDRDLMQHIELCVWNHFSSEDQWYRHVADALLISYDDLRTRLQCLNQWRGLCWDDRQGSLVFTC